LLFGGDENETKKKLFGMRMRIKINLYFKTKDDIVKLVSVFLYLLMIFFIK